VRWRGWQLHALAALPALVLLAVHAARYYPFIADDALISLRYADRLLDGDGLTWTEGERVEGYSNLLWVLACAALGGLGFDLIDAARLLGVLGVATAIGCVVGWERERGQVGWIGGGIAGAAVAGTGCVAVWTIGGLEQPAVMGLLALGLVGARRLVRGEAGPWAAGLPLALLCWTRPDGALLVAAVAAAVWLAAGPTCASLRSAILLGLPGLAAVVAQLGFRLLYYGDWVSNTARAKLALTDERLATGWTYVSVGVRWMWPIAIAAALAPVVARERRRELVLIGLPLGVWLGYTIFIGGDIFPARRHLGPAVVLCGFAIATTASAALVRRRSALFAVAAGLSAVVVQTYLTWRDPHNRRAIRERWEWDGEVIGRLLARGFAAERPLVAADPAGCIPYFSRLPSLDLLGLNDRYLATHPPASFGRGFLGHELGDGPYVLRRAPDVVVLCTPRGSAEGCFRSGRELLELPAFRRDYALVTFEGRAPRTVRSRLWVRRGGRIGVRAWAERVELPGFLLAAHTGVATLDDAGRMGVELAAGAGARWRPPEAAAIAPGWRVEVEATGAVEVAVTAPGVLTVRTTSAAHLRRVVVHRP